MTSKQMRKTREPSRQDVRYWMALNSEGYHSATALAEAAPVPAAWLDDETHWIWEEALEAVGFNDPEITSEAD